MRPAIALIALLGLCGCSAQDLASLVCGGPPPTSNNPVVPQLLYPVPGYNQVPDNAPTMVVAYSLSPSAAFPIVITTKGKQMTLGAMKPPPHPLPQPIANELTPGTPRYGVALPALTAHASYTVQYKDVVSYCGHTFVNYYNMGSFTTQ